MYVAPRYFDQSTFNNIVYDIPFTTDTAISWSAQIIIDVFIFLFTLIRTLHIRIKDSRNIVDILLRDGASDISLELPLTP